MGKDEIVEALDGGENEMKTSDVYSVSLPGTPY